MAPCHPLALLMRSGPAAAVLYIRCFHWIPHVQACVGVLGRLVAVVALAVLAATGTLASVGWDSTQGKTPRFFGIYPAGTFLYAANQNSDTIVTFRVDQVSGRLTPTGQIVKNGSPVCIVFR